MITEYAKRLRQAMHHAGLNQKGLISKTGLSQSTVSSAMNRSNGSTDTATYAIACGVNADWLATKAKWCHHHHHQIRLQRKWLQRKKMQIR